MLIYFCALQEDIINRSSDVNLPVDDKRNTDSYKQAVEEYKEVMEVMNIKYLLFHLILMSNILVQLQYIDLFNLLACYYQESPPKGRYRPLAYYDLGCEHNAGNAKRMNKQCVSVFIFKFNCNFVKYVNKLQNSQKNIINYSFSHG